MRKLLISTASMLAIVASPLAAEPVALTGATIVDGNGGKPIEKGTVILDGDRIISVGAAADVKIPPGVKRIDLTGKWITPGLIDAHVHFFQSGGLYTRPDAIDLSATVPYAQDVARSKARLDDTFARYLASGVTTVVDAGGPLWNFEVRKRAAASARAPRVAVAGPLIATEPTPEQKRLDLGDPPIISAATPEDARKLAEAQLRYKPDFIKIWGIGSGPEGSARVRDITRAVASVAHAARTRVAVHATELDTAQAAVDGGADILVHSVENAALPQRFIDQVKARGIVYVTTIVVHEGYSDALLGHPDLMTIERTNGAPDIIQSLYEMPPAIIAQVSNGLPADPLPQVFANARAMVGAGARVAAGTDAGNIGTLHGPSLHRELQLLSRAGLTPAQVLTAATRDAAYVYAPKPDIGLVAPGYRADLLVLDADPLKSVANLSRIAQVWSRGAAFSPAALLHETPERVVQRQLERYNAHDLDGFLATYTHDAELFDLPAAGKASVAGKDEFRRIYGQLFAAKEPPTCKVAQRIVEGRFVIDQEVCFAGAGKPPVHAAATYEVQDGLIRRVWFADPLAPAD